MANYYYLSKILSIPLIITIISSSINARPHDNKRENITIAMQDMQKSRYFTFVMLIKMVSTKIPPNITLLMPNDRMLSTASISEKQILNFIFQHSIPSPLNFLDLKNLPNGTILPSHEPYYMLKTAKKYGKFYINNAELVAPDLCEKESLFKCHGINAVLRRKVVQQQHRRSPVGCQIESPPSISPDRDPTVVVQPPAQLPSLPPLSGISPALSPEMENEGGVHKSEASSELGFRVLVWLVVVSFGLVFGMIM